MSHHLHPIVGLSLPIPCEKRVKFVSGESQMLPIGRRANEFGRCESIRCHVRYICFPTMSTMHGINDMSHNTLKTYLPVCFGLFFLRFHDHVHNHRLQFQGQHVPTVVNISEIFWGGQERELCLVIHSCQRSACQRICGCLKIHGIDQILKRCLWFLEATCRRTTKTPCSFVGWVEIATLREFAQCGIPVQRLRRLLACTMYRSLRVGHRHGSRWLVVPIGACPFRFPCTSCSTETPICHRNDRATRGETVLAVG